MKLFVILSLVACSYAAKLDRTYLPPASASTAGGSPGSLTAPSGPGGFGLSGGRGSGSGAAPSGSYGAPSGPSGFGPSSGSTNLGQGGQSGFNPSGSSSQTGFSPSAQSGFGASGQSGQAGFGPSGQAAPNTFGQAAGGFGQQSAGVNQGGSFQGQNAGQGFQQPERAQASADRNAEILKYENQNDGETFSYSFETSNGISAEESGVATNGVQAQGGYSYTGDDGQFYKITYTADENGYVPQGDHLPTPPPIPEEILRAIEINAAAAAAGTQEGAYNPDEDNEVPQQYNTGFNAGSSANNEPQGGRPGQQGGAFNQQGSYNQGGNQQGSFPGATSGYGKGPQSQGPASQFSQGSSVQAPSGSFNQGAQGFSGNRGQGNGQGANGYEYNRPQANAQFSGQPQGPVNQYKQPQASRPSAPSGAAQSAFRPQGFNQGAQSVPQGPSGAFKPTAPTGPAQGSFKPQGFNQGTQSSPQGPSNAFNPSAPTGSAQRPSGFPRPSAPSSAAPSQGYNYNQPGQSRPQGFGQAPQGSGSSFSRPSSPLAGSQGSFGPQNDVAAPSGPQGPSGFSRPSAPSQGSFSKGQQAGGNTGLIQAPYQYNRPQQGLPSPGSQASQRPQGFQQASQGSQRPQGFSQGSTQGPRGQSFEGPRQAPSFDEQEGYKY